MCAPERLQDRRVRELVARGPARSRFFRRWTHRALTRWLYLPARPIYSWQRTPNGERRGGIDCDRGGWASERSRGENASLGARADRRPSGVSPSACSPRFFQKNRPPDRPVGTVRSRYEPEQRLLQPPTQPLAPHTSVTLLFFGVASEHADGRAPRGWRRIGRRARMAPSSRRLFFSDGRPSADSAIAPNRRSPSACSENFAKSRLVSPTRPLMPCTFVL